MIFQANDNQMKDFSGSPVVETWPPNTGGADLIPGQEAKIPQASQPKKKKPKMD